MPSSIRTVLIAFIERHLEALGRDLCALQHHVDAADRARVIQMALRLSACSLDLRDMRAAEPIPRAPEPPEASARARRGRDVQELIGGEDGRA